MDPTLLWHPWLDHDVRHSSLYAAFVARAVKGSISFSQLCGMLCELSVVPEIVQEETFAFLRNHIHVARLQQPNDPSSVPVDHDALPFQAVESLFNATVDFLLGTDEHGAPLDAQQRACRFPRIDRPDPETGATALFDALENDDLTTTDLLLRFGANPNYARHDGATPLYLACKQGNPQIARALLLASADPHLSVDRMGATPFYIACHKGHAPVVEQLCVATSAPSPIRAS